MRVDKPVEHFEVSYFRDPIKGCFDTKKPNPNKIKRDKTKEQRLHIHNLDNSKTMTFTVEVTAVFIVCGEETKTVTEERVLAKVHPLIPSSSGGIAGPGSSPFYVVSPDMGLGHVPEGSYAQLRIIPDNPCDHGDVSTRSHTEWHIEC